MATTVLLLAGTAIAAQAAPPPPPAMTLSSVAGPASSGNTVIGTVAPVPNLPGPFPAATLPVVQFQYTTCAATAKAPALIAATDTTLTAGVLTVDPADVQRISNNKIAFQVPAGGYPDP